MGLHLPFRLHHEAQAHRIPEPAGQQPGPERTRVPEWIEQRRAATELVQPAPRPRQMVGFLTGSLLQLSTRGAVRVASAWAV